MDVLYAPDGKTGGLSLASVIWIAKVRVELSWGAKVSRTITWKLEKLTLTPLTETEKKMIQLNYIHVNNPAKNEEYKVNNI